MDLKNKYAVHTVRTLFGLFLTFTGATGLWMGIGTTPEPLMPIMQVFYQTGFFHVIKITELVAGLMLVANFLPALAVLFIAPLAIGILVFNAMVAPEMMPMGAVVALLNIYLGYVYWDKYNLIFKK